jgi:hypothetical protein
MVTKLWISIYGMTIWTLTGAFAISSALGDDWL